MKQPQTFRDLPVYQTALQEMKRLFLLSKGFPKEEQHALTDPLRLAARAVGAAIAAAWARRRFTAAFIDRLNAAQGDVLVVQAWLDHALLCRCIDEELHGDLDGAWSELADALDRLIEDAASFAHPAP